MIFRISLSKHLSSQAEVHSLSAFVVRVDSNLDAHHYSAVRNLLIYETLSKTPNAFNNSGTPLMQTASVYQI